MFDELQSSPHRNIPGGTQWRGDFPNGYGISVVTGDHEFFYTDPEHPYEVAVILHGGICYTTPITDDVLGRQTEADVLRVIEQIKALPAA